MRALTLTDGELKLDPAYPTPGESKPIPPGEALIRPTRMGVCSTDLELVKGYMGFAGVLGHEFVGVVEAVADDVRGEGRQWVGRRVVGRINCVCGGCDMCKAGLGEHCRDRTVLGILKRDDVFAQRFTLPIDNLLPVPDHVDDDRAVFAEPLAAAFQIVRQLTIEGRPYITVLGDGRLGLLCAQVLSQLNATVRCVGKHPDKLALCDKWGVKNRPLDEVGLREDQDIVVDCTGSPTGLPTAMRMVRPRGTIVLKTTVAPPPPDATDHTHPHVDLAPIVINELTIIGSRCGPFETALHALSKESVDVLSLITKRVRLDDAPAALRDARNAGVKTLIEP